MVAQTIINIWWNPDAEAYNMIVPYSTGFKTAFELALPASDRSFDFDTKIWTFTERHLTAIASLVEKLWHTKPTIITRIQVERANSGGNIITSATIDSVIATFVKMLPYEAMQQAYKRAAMLMHPDRGGDMEQMSKLNAAWQRLERELYKKG